MRVGEEDGQHYSILEFDAIQFRTEHQYLAETCCLRLQVRTVLIFAYGF